MNRRDLLKHIAILTGTAVLGAEPWLTGCKANPLGVPVGLFPSKDVAFLDEVAEIILPRTDTPGAKDAKTGRFIAEFATNCYDAQEQQTLKAGLLSIDKASLEAFQKPFMRLHPQQRLELLTSIDAQASTYARENEHQETAGPSHYFTLLKQATLLGFFTSEAGATRVLRYDPVPGKYQGCIAYKKGEKAWM